MKIILILLAMILNSNIIIAQVEIIAHRGASFIAPENTLSAYKIAFENGIKSAECDVFLTLDNQIVLSHDKSMMRLAGEDLDITNTTYDIIKSIDVGSYKGIEYQNEKIPLLVDILNILPHDATLYVEIKDNHRIIPFLSDLIKSSGKMNQITIIAFDYDVLVTSKKELSNVPHYWLIHKEEEKKNLIKKLKMGNLDGVNANYKIIDKELIKLIKDEWYKCYAWTVNDIGNAEKLSKLGINGITTDRPMWMRDNFENNISVFTEIFSHNDYDNLNPLYDAISNGCVHIEIDVYYVNGNLFVAHDFPDTLKSKTIESLYLNPLREILTENQGELFKHFSSELYIMIDIKNDGKNTYQKLKQIFMPYKDYISRVENGEFKKGLLRIFVSGNKPIDDILRDDIQIIGFDGRLENLDKDYSSEISPIVSDYWFNITNWDGISQITNQEFEKLKNYASKVHSQNKKARLWGAPDNINAWKIQKETGIDLINTDKLAELRQFLINYKDRNEKR